MGSQVYGVPPERRAEELPPSVRAVLRSPGRRLDRMIEVSLWPFPGARAGDVRIHTDSTAADSARSLDATAYTVGRHVVFAAGAYAPSTRAGSAILAHELTHVAQHLTHRARQPAAVLGEPSGGSELQADRVAEAAASGRRAQESHPVMPDARIMRYRSRGSPYFGRSDDPANGLVEGTFADAKKQPWIEHITVDFDGSAEDGNPGLTSLAPADRRMATGRLRAVYHKNSAALPEIVTAVTGGSSAIGLTDSGSDLGVIRIEGVGYNAALQPGQTSSVQLVKGTKYTKDPDPTSATFTGAASMHFAVFFNRLQALHQGPMDVGSHACVHVPNPPMQQINYHSVVGRTKVTVSYSSRPALQDVCCARFRQIGVRRNPCGGVGCP